MSLYFLPSAFVVDLAADLPVLYWLQMVLPNWLKILWWFCILAVLTTLLWWRKANLLAGNGAPFDIVVFIIWTCLMLAPIFSEVKIFGIQLTQKLEELDKQVATLSAEVRNTIDLRAQVNPQFNFTTPPPDSQLPRIEESIREVLKHELKTLGVGLVSPKVDKDLVADEDSVYLFRVRRSIEMELRRVCVEKFGDDDSCKRAASGSLILSIQRQELLSRELIKAIGSVYAVCSASIHGEKATQEQLSFVKDVSPGLLAALRAI